MLRKFNKYVSLEDSSWLDLIIFYGFLAFCSMVVMLCVFSLIQIGWLL